MDPKAHFLIEPAKEWLQRCPMLPLVLWGKDNPRSPRKGAKMFFTGEFSRLFRNMRNMNVRDRNFYEILLEGNPLRLYLDIEVYYAKNPEYADTAYSVEKIRALLEFFVDLVNELCTPAEHVRPTHIRECDSSNAEKLSRHYIFEYAAACFRDYIAIARFMDWAYTRLPDSLWIYPEKATDKVPLFDTSVYTRNRNFRFIGNAKHEKDPMREPRFLWPVHGELGAEPTRGHDAITYEIFCTYTVSQRLKESEQCGTLWTIDDGAVCQRSWDFASTRGLGARPASCAPSSKRARPSADASLCTSYMGTGGAPSCVVTLARNCFHQTKIEYNAQKHTFWCSAADNTFHSRFCALADKEHRSNQIIVVVTMYSSLPEFDRTWYQKCHDAECKDKRTKRQRVPADFDYLCDEYVAQCVEKTSFGALWTHLMC